jgi:hypothetical protein
MEAEIGADGTLSKVVSETDSSPEKAAELIPFKETLSKAVGVKAASSFAPEVSTEAVKVRIEVTVEEDGYLYDCYRYFDKRVDSLTVIPFDRKTGLFQRRLLREPPKKEEPAPAQDDSTSSKGTTPPKPKPKK